MCQDATKKQTILISGVPSSGSYSQFLSFRFVPKKMIVRQVFLSDSGGARITAVYCRQLSPDPLCITQAANNSSTGTIDAIGNEFIVPDQLFTGTYTFTFELGGLVPTTNYVRLLLEFTD